MLIYFFVCSAIDSRAKSLRISSADSLSIVGRLVELGLRSGAWTDVEEPAEEIPNEPENIEQNDPDNSDLTSDEDDSNQILLISAWLVVFCAVMWIIFADKRGEG